MAGLTDMSMGEIKRLDDSGVDGNFSMAEIETDDINDSGDAGETGHRIKSSALPKGNILDELKNESKYLNPNKESDDLLDQKRRLLNDS